MESINEKQALAQLIREDRLRRHMTTTEHAEFLGVHHTTYHLWLRGQRIAPGAIAVWRILKPDDAESVEIAA